MVSGAAAADDARASPRPSARAHTRRTVPLKRDRSGQVARPWCALGGERYCANNAGRDRRGSQAAYEAFGRNDFEGFIDCVDPEADWYPLAHEIEGARHGHDGVRLWWAGLFAVFPDLNPQIAELRDMGDRVLINMQGGGSGENSGVGIDLNLWQVVEIRNGLIVRYSAHRTEAEALEEIREREGR